MGYTRCDTKLLGPPPPYWGAGGTRPLRGLERHRVHGGLGLRGHRPLLHVEGADLDALELAAVVLVQPVDQGEPVGALVLVLEPDRVGVDHPDRHLLPLRRPEGEDQAGARLPPDPVVLRETRLTQEEQDLLVGDVELGLTVGDGGLGDAERDLHENSFVSLGTGDHRGPQRPHIWAPLPRGPTGPAPPRRGGGPGVVAPPAPDPRPPRKGHGVREPWRRDPRGRGQFNLQREVHVEN